MGTEDAERIAEPLEQAIVSLNKAWEVLKAGEGLAGLVSAAALRAGCTEYCGSYDGCTGYCKPMGAAKLQDLGRPPERIQSVQRLPFSG